MTIIVLEGPDGAGKSTLAAMLASFEPFTQIRHFGPPEDPADAERVWTEAVKRCSPSRMTIFDRLHWGEIAYGEVYRDGSSMGWEGFHRINDVLESMNAITVYVRVPPDESVRRVEHDGDDYVHTEDLPRIVELYDEMMLKCRSTLHVIDNRVAMSAALFANSIYTHAKLRRR